MNSFYRKYGKRMFDILLSAVVLILISPLLIIIAILVKINLGSPVIFMQERPGLNGEIFKLYKFRSMTDDRDSKGNLLPNEKRLTKFGKLLRSTSLDELPELWNILVGDMSFVGPRPLLTSYLPLYNEFQSRRHDVRPGLTGYAQVNGRNATTWSNRFQLDVEYVEKLSLSLDLTIMIQTFLIVFKREGVNSSENVTMKPFSGNETD